MYKRITAVLTALGLGLVLALLNPSAAQAAQVGLQQIHVPTTSWSQVYTQFNCGNYNVPTGQTWGEGQSNPLCGGTVDGDREPNSVYIGAGWCVTRYLTKHSDNTVIGPQYAWGGGSGGWQQIWSQIYTPQGYTNTIEAWYGSWCPTSGAAGHSTWN